MALAIMGMLPGSGLPSSVACTAPHLVWPSTIMVFTPSASTPYSKVPVASTQFTKPAVRTGNRSPTPWSKMISSGTRESEQLRMATDGL